MNTEETLATIANINAELNRATAYLDSREGQRQLLEALRETTSALSGLADGVRLGYPHMANEAIMTEIDQAIAHARYVIARAEAK